MPLPAIKRKERIEPPTKPKKKKYGLQAETVDEINACNCKAAAIRKALKGTNEEIDYTLEQDIERAIGNVVSKYTKTLDHMIAERGLLDQPPPVPPEEPEHQQPLFESASSS